MQTEPGDVWDMSCMFMLDNVYCYFGWKVKATVRWLIECEYTGTDVISCIGYRDRLMVYIITCSEKALVDVELLLLLSCDELIMQYLNSQIQQ